MENMLDWLRESKNMPIGSVPFNEVDNLICASLSYLPLNGLISDSHKDKKSLGSLCKTILDEKRELEEGCPGMMEDIVNSIRYRDMTVDGFVDIWHEKKQLQFAAITLDTKDGFHYVSFRRTDSTFAGWKEDFNMAFQSPVPAQELSVKYLTSALKSHKGRTRVGGISKGGNLSMYSASFISRKRQSRVFRVFNNDGPGFDRPILQTPGYQRVRSKISVFVPESSVVGLLLWQEAPYTIIKSTAAGILQHNPFSWVTKGAQFLTTDELSKESRFLDRTLKNWVSSMSYEERQTFIDEIYRIITKTGARTVDEFAADWARNVAVVLEELKDLPPEMKRFFTQMLWLLLKASVSGSSPLYKSYEKTLKRLL